jgi:phosphoribosylglycinamide formyltransferase 1
MTLPIGVLASGTGTNLQAILDAIAHGQLDACVRIVISNNPEAKALLVAERAGVPSAVLSHKAFEDRGSFDAALVQALQQARVGWVVLAGFMRLLGPVLLNAFPLRVINIHPALLPAFPGVDAQAQALAYGVRMSGCTVHFVDEGADSGPVIAQSAVPVLPDDTRETLSARIGLHEHRLLVAVLSWIAQGRVSVVDRGPGARACVRVEGYCDRPAVPELP